MIRTDDDGVGMHFCDGFGLEVREAQCKCRRGFARERGFIHVGTYRGVGETETIQELAAVPRRAR